MSGKEIKVQLYEKPRRRQTLIYAKNRNCAGTERNAALRQAD